MKLIKNIRFLITEDKILENVDIYYDSKIRQIKKSTENPNETDRTNQINIINKTNTTNTTNTINKVKKTHEIDENKTHVVNENNHLNETNNINDINEVIDGTNLIVMPGLINAHTHAAMIALRGYSDDKRLFDWLKKVNSIEDKMTERMVYLSSKLAIMEMLMTGTVGFIDQYFYEEETAKAVEEFKIYAMLGTPFVDQTINDRIERFKRFVSTKKQYIIPIINPHSIYTCSKETLKTVKKLSDEYSVRVNIHAAETRLEVMECYKKNKMYVIEYLNSLGLLKNSILAHCGWITKNEIPLIKENNVTVVNNPISNMKLATGAFFPYRELKQNGINIALGTDGAASNNSLNMFNEMKVMSLLHKHSYWDSEVINAKEAFDAATINGYKAMGLNFTIKVNNPATFVAIPTTNISLMPLRKDNLISNIVYSFSGNVSLNIIDGVTVFDNSYLKEWLKKAKFIEKEINNLY